MKKPIIDLIVTILCIGLVVVFLYPTLSKAKYKDDLEPTPTTTNTPSPIPTVTIENTPTSTPLPTSTPIPQIISEGCFVEDYNDFYKELLGTLYDRVEDVLCIKIDYSNGVCTIVVLAKLNGVWEIVEISQG